MADPPWDAGTAVAALARHARTGATMTFPGTGAVLDAAGWWDGARRLAGALVADGVRPGAVVGLLVPTGPAFPVGMFGVLAAGAAVSVLPTRAWGTDPAAEADQLARLVDTARMRHVLVHPDHRAVGAALRRLRPGLRLVDPAETGSAPLPDTGPDDLALVQFTSGSTGRPKGVCLSHRVLLAGLRAVAESSAVTGRDVFVQWVPHHHDMGLITPLAYAFAGARTHLFDPLAFVARPERVLGYLAERHGTAFTAPNFGYDLIADTVSPDRVSTWDLRSWRLAYNGAEPVRADTVGRFAAHLAPAGVGDAVMFPAYGMAEATVAISAGPPGSPARIAYLDRDRLAGDGRAVRADARAPHARAVVSMGNAVPGLALRVADEDGAECGPGRVGEVRIRGASVTGGYLHDPERTRAAFDGGWLRTGDLGCRIDGELYLTGRRADMIVVAGRNYFPEDVEQIAATVPGVADRRALAVAVTGEGGDEYIGVAVEADPRVDGRRLAGRVRGVVSDRIGLGTVLVRVLPPGGLPRTANGKWRRGALREAFTPRPVPQLAPHPIARADTGRVPCTIHKGENRDRHDAHTHP